MHEWVKTLHAKVPIKSKIGEAFSYFENEYEYLKSRPDLGPPVMLSR